MFSIVEFKRLITEWRTRFQRVQAILQPPQWNEEEWRRFSQGVTLLVVDHGQSWIIEDRSYWDLRWQMKCGGELIAQVEHLPNERTTLIVAQEGGFAEDVGSYTWLWAEFDPAGEFARDPYWVDGAWREALTMFLLPFQQQAGFLLEGQTSTPQELLLQDGAQPNPHQGQPAQLSWQTREQAGIN